MKEKIAEIADRIDNGIESISNNGGKFDNMMGKVMFGSFYAGAVAVGACAGIDDGSLELREAFLAGATTPYALFVTSFATLGAVAGLIESVKSSTSKLAATVKAIPYSVGAAAVGASTGLFVGVGPMSAGAIGGLTTYGAIKAVSQLF